MRYSDWEALKQFSLQLKEAARESRLQKQEEANRFYNPDAEEPDPMEY